MKQLACVSVDNKETFRVISVNGRVRLERFLEFDDACGDNWVMLWEGHSRKVAMIQLSQAVSNFNYGGEVPDLLIA